MEKKGLYLDLCTLPIKNGSVNWTQDVRGIISNALRKDAGKIFVFVTDNNPFSFISHHTFIDAAKIFLGDKPIKVFAFINKTNSQCIHEELPVGKTYEALAKATGGRTFDICKSDWSGHFDQLTKDVQNSLHPGFKLDNSSIEKILSVAFNGTTIEGDKFWLDNGIIKIDKDILKQNGTVTIKYEYSVAGET